MDAFQKQYQEMLQVELDELRYRNDRLKMNGDASARLAEYRMRRIFELERRIEELERRLHFNAPMKEYKLTPS